MKDPYTYKFRVKYYDVELCFSRVFLNFQAFGTLNGEAYKIKLSPLCLDLFLDKQPRLPGKEKMTKVTMG